MDFYAVASPTTITTALDGETQTPLPSLNLSWPMGGTGSDLPFFDTRRSLQSDIIACAVVTWLIALTFVGLRFYTRGRLLDVLGSTDWCILLSVAFAGGVSVSSVEQAVRGAGKHIWQSDPEQVPALSRAAWYGILFYTLSLTLTKVSILLLYSRLFTTLSWARRANFAVLVCVLAISVWLVASVFTACVPLRAFWDWRIVQPTAAAADHVYCQPIGLWWAVQGLHIATDLIIVVLPIPVLVRVSLPVAPKLGLLAVFTLGFFVCIVSVLRLLALIRIETSPPLDPTYSAAELIFWTTVETNAAISCACTVTLRPLALRLFSRGQNRTQPRPARCSSSFSSSSFVLSVPSLIPSLVSFFQKLLGRGRLRLGSLGGRNYEGGNKVTPSRGRSIRPRSLVRTPSWSPNDESRWAVRPASDGGLLKEVLGAMDDLEAQRGAAGGADSCMSMIPRQRTPEEDEEEIMRLGGGFGSLRAPPKAHLRLSIQVTKTVQVTSESLRNAA
ncbi:hypothetical protein VTK73DRAFT_8260 [Phialemonium thermophilum]|uniref:Rhodopsin domain-containing protein n=1 Tax=Phialemonium thermophilum TaxID=223376 RepID=A0ABR3XQN8_9PEZI